VGDLQRAIEERGIETVVCVSHRPAFWVSNLKRREGLDISVWGVLGEYGKNLGWKYQFWDQIDGFLSPVERNMIGFELPARVRFIKINLPAKKEYYDISSVSGDINSILLVCGFWGQGPIIETVKSLLSAFPDIRVHVVCGENRKAYEKLQHLFADNPNIQAYGVIPSLAPLLRECASIITKPGISTLLEGNAAQRKIFLLKGMPVAEDNNARFAVEHFRAQWFEIKTFEKWYVSQREGTFT
jgi:UDP-N-acetylglucosamine:LPS N-acetylglucosamine transferase